MSTRLLKAYGHLPGAELGRLEDGREASMLIDPAALQGRCCGHPDLPDPEIAAADPHHLVVALGFPLPECQNLKAAHRRMMKAQGQGSWPAGCHADYENHHAATYHVDRNSFPSWWHSRVSDAGHQMTVDAKVWGVNSVSECRQRWGDQSYLDVSWWLAFEAMRRRGCVHIEVQDRDQANILIRAKPIPGSTIGYAYYNNGTCGDQVTLTIDSTWRPSKFLHNAAWLNLHELGHTSNLGHEFQNQDAHHSIMSYRNLIPFQGFRDASTPNWNYRPDASLPDLAEHYGPDPVPLKDDPAPPPPEPTGSPWAEGVDGYLRVHGPIASGEYADFNLTPRTRL